MKVIAVPLLLLLVLIPFGAKASSGLAEPQIPLPSVSWPQYPTPDNITDIKEIPKEDQPRGWLLRRLDNLWRH